MPLAEDVDALKRTIYGEARGEPFQGQIAVGHVIWNRAHHPTIKWWGVGIKGVCFASSTNKHGVGVFQFSCWSPTDPNSGLARVANENMSSFVRATAAACLVMERLAPDPTQGASHYHSDSIPPPAWTKGATKTVTIGHHVFYRDVK